MYSAERHFVKTAHHQMGILEKIWELEAESLVSPSGEDQTGTALQMIKSSAVPVQARGVFRAAALCEDVLGRFGVEGAAKLRASLLGLQSLIRQYADGLFEIDPGFKDLLSGKTAPEPVSIPGSLADAHQKAANVLAPLLKLVKNDNSLQALRSLMRPAHEQMPLEPRTGINFDTLMGPVTNLSLGEARQHGKTVSISYAADFDKVERELAQNMQAFLETICLNIVVHGVTDQGSQIGITAQKTENRVRLTVNWYGQELAKRAKDSRHFQKAVLDLETQGGTIDFHAAALINPEGSPQSLEIYYPLPTASKTAQTKSVPFERARQKEEVVA